MRQRDLSSTPAEALSAPENGNGQTDGDLGDTCLVLALARGRTDVAALAWRRHGAAVHSLAVRLCRPRQAEDVTRAVFLSLSHSPGNFHPAAGSLRALLLAETHRRAVDLLRADAPRCTGETGMSADILEKMVLARGASQGIRRLLAGLPTAERQAIILAYFGGYTCRQVAALLRQPEQTVNCCIRTGMVRLRGILSDQGRCLPPRARLPGTAGDLSRPRPRRAPAQRHVHRPAARMTSAAVSSVPLLLCRMRIMHETSLDPARGSPRDWVR